MSAPAVAKDGFAVQFERPTADVAAVEPGAPHAGANSFDDQTALQLGDGANDHHDGPAQSSTGIDVLAETRVFDAQTDPDIYKLSILADVAPYSREYNIARQAVAKEAQNNTQLRIEYEKILEQVKQTKESSIKMDNRHFTEPTEQIQGTVASVSPAGITLKEFPGRVFQYSSFGLSAADMSARVLGENKTRCLRPWPQQEPRAPARQAGLLSILAASIIPCAALGRAAMVLPAGKLFLSGWRIYRPSPAGGFCRGTAEVFYSCASARWPWPACVFSFWSSNNDMPMAGIRQEHELAPSEPIDH